MAVDPLQHAIDVSQSNLDMHQETKNLSHKAINNTIFVVGTGTFVLSINFLANVNYALLFPEVLIVAWALLLISIGANGISHWYMIQQASEQIRLNNEWRRQGLAGDIEKIANESPRLQHVIKWGSRFGLAAIATLIIGSGLLLVFVSTNLLGRNEQIKIMKLQVHIPEVQTEDYKG